MTGVQTCALPIYEINVYANRYELTNWVAVDDLNLKLWIPERFVHCTRANEGIKQSNVKEKILNILKTDN